MGGALLGLTLSLAATHAHADQASDLLRDAASALTDVETVRADIRQELVQFKTTRRFSGRYIGAAGQFRIELTEPRPQTILYTDSGIEWYIPHTKKLWESKKKERRKSDLAFNPGALLSLASEGFSYEAYRKKKLFGWLQDHVEYTLTPNEKRSDMSKLVVTIDMKTRRIITIDLYDTTGQLSARQRFSRYKNFAEGGAFPGIVAVQFWTPAGNFTSTTYYTNIRINEPVDPEVFTLNVPEGTERVPLKGFAP